MRIRVRLFAMQRQQLGVRELPLELAQGSTVADAWATLAALHPLIAPAGPTLRFARNAVYADPAEVLADGDELALIPPVAGGSADPDGSDGVAADRVAADRGPFRRIELHEVPFDDDLLGELRRAVATVEHGAVVLFLGQTRATPGTPAPGQEAEAARFQGRTVQALDYEAFEPMVLAVLGQVADEMAERFGVTRLAILHRTGEVPLGEASVVIAVAGGHRGEAFEACRYAIEELKARAPIWKSERFTDGSVWIGAPARTGPDTVDGPT